MRASRGMGVVIVATHPELKTRRCNLESGVTVGSARECELRLPPPVEEGHARFLYRDGRVIVVDGMTESGTFVNGCRIDRPCVVVTTDRVAIEDWNITLDSLEHVEAPLARRNAELLAALAASPGDDALRQVYGDFLEGNGWVTEAEILSIEREIRRADGRIDLTAHGRLGFRLRTFASKVPFEWRAVVMRPPIEGCSQHEDCPRFWDGLAPTHDRVVRRCTACEQEVYLCETLAAASEHVDKKRRVAVDLAVERHPHDLAIPLGRLPSAAMSLLSREDAVTQLPFFR